MPRKENNFLRYTGQIFAFIGFAALVYFSIMFLFGDRIVPAASAQTDRYLESRLNQIEQRFYQLESRLNRIEQDAITRRVPGTSPVPDTRDQELGLLRNEITGLRVRLGEVECGLLKLDERTLPAPRRLGSRPGNGSDKCRQDWSSPIYLSSRP